MNRRSGRKCRRAAAALLAFAMSIAPHAAAQPSGSPDVGRFYAFGGFALLAPGSNDQLQGERGAAGLIAGGGLRASPLLSLELGVLGAGYRLDTPASVSVQIPAGTNLQSHISTESLNLAAKIQFPHSSCHPSF